jgi:hypothetical protein
MLAGNTTYVEPGSFESIATVTTAGTTVTFSSISSSYTHLQLRVIGKSSNTTYDSVYWTMRFNGDTGNNYNCYSMSGDGSSVSAMGNGTYTDQMIAGEIVASKSGIASELSSPVIIDILDYGSTSKLKTIRALSGWDSNSSGNVRIAGGLWNSTSAVTSISIIGGSSQIHAALYGIKSA